MYIFLFLFACVEEVNEEPQASPQKTTQEKPVAEVPLNEVIPVVNEDFDILRRKLSTKHQKSTCAELSSLYDDLYPLLGQVISEVQMPPWAGMRAAQCMIDLYPERGKAEFTKWISGPNTKGLASLLANQFDSLPTPMAIELVKVGFDGPYEDYIRLRLARSKNPELLGLLE
jgi:hypothetical protein